MNLNLPGRISRDLGLFGGLVVFQALTTRESLFIRGIVLSEWAFVFSN